MKKPGKHWSWTAATKIAAAGAANGAVAGAIVGILDPTGATALVGAAIGALTGFTGSLAGEAAGYLMDDQPDRSFASMPLYNFVVGLLLSTVLAFAVVLADVERLDFYRAIAVVAFTSNLITAGSARLIEDIRARRRWREDSY